jgi:hypothetical protein
MAYFDSQSSTVLEGDKGLMIKQSNDYFQSCLPSKILSIFFELQIGQIDKSDTSSKYVPQLLQRHFILISSIQSPYNNLSFNGGYQYLKPLYEKTERSKDMFLKKKMLQNA